jgi:Flp pilus assembly protein TadD
MATGTAVAERDACLRDGYRLQAQGDWRGALAKFEEAGRFSPRDLETLVPTGFALIQLKDWHRAAETHERIVLLLPKDFRVWCNLSYLYEHAGELTQAEDRARKALRLAPDSGEAWNNLGLALRGQHRLPEALQAFRHAVARQPEFALAEFNLATTYLLMGDGAHGWPGYEARSRLPEARLRSSIAARWDGNSLPSGRLLVFSDQGFGDVLQFVRFLPEAKARSQARVILSSPPELTPLLDSVAGADEVVDQNLEPAGVAAEIALASLPGLLRTDPRQTTCPYLRADKQLAPSLLSGSQASLRVGLAWQGNPAQSHDYIRSVPLNRLLPWADVPGVEWFSLQVNEAGRSQIADAPQWALRDLGAELKNFAETAAVVQQLDLVITVDTSLAHLCGALGQPVWTLLGHTPDWRWGLTGDSTPWYPTMRLFRQPRRGDWDPVVAQVKQALAIEAKLRSARAS